MLDRFWSGLGKKKSVLKWKKSKDRRMYELKKKTEVKLLSLSTEFEADFIHFSICAESYQY